MGEYGIVNSKRDGSIYRWYRLLLTIFEVKKKRKIEKEEIF